MIGGAGREVPFRVLLCYESEVEVRKQDLLRLSVRGRRGAVPWQPSRARVRCLFVTRMAPARAAPGLEALYIGGRRHGGAARAHRGRIQEPPEAGTLALCLFSHERLLTMCVRARGQNFVLKLVPDVTDPANFDIGGVVTTGINVRSKINPSSKRAMDALPAGRPMLGSQSSQLQPQYSSSKLESCVRRLAERRRGD